MTDNLAERIDDDDLAERIIEFNESNRRGTGRIFFPNERLAALWIHELLGQLSDGAWENHWPGRVDSWEDYYSLRIDLDTELSWPHIENSTIEGGLVDFLNRKPQRDDDLVDIIGDRMVEYVRQYGNPDYDEDDLREDLLLLNDTVVE